MSSAGKEAVTARLYAGDFLAEGCIAGRALRVATATAMEATVAVLISKREMIRVIHEEHSRSTNRLEECGIAMDDVTNDLLLCAFCLAIFILLCGDFF